MTTNPTDGPIHTWFGLSYCNYQVLHRTLMQSMPIEWQERMVACLEELADAYQHIEQPECFDVKAATEHIVNEMTEAELAEAGIETDWYDEPVPEDYGPFDLAEWRAEHEKDAPTYHDRDGNEVDPHSRVLLVVPDPVPHYNRGRTYIEPRPAGPDPCSGCRYATCATGSRTLTETEHNRAWHAVEGAAGEEGADPGTVLNAVLRALGINPPAEETHVVADDSDDPERIDGMRRPAAAAVPAVPTTTKDGTQ